MESNPKSSGYGYKLDTKFDKAYVGKITKEIMGSIGNSPANIGDTVIVSVCFFPSGSKGVVGINKTSRGRDISLSFDEAKDYITLLGVSTEYTADDVIMMAINIHNKRVW